MRVEYGANGARGRTPAEGRPEASINVYELLNLNETFLWRKRQELPYRRL